MSSRLKSGDILEEGDESTVDREPVSVVTSARPRNLSAVPAAQIRDLVRQGMSVSDIKNLAEAGVTAEEMIDIAAVTARPSGNETENAMRELTRQNQSFMESVIQKARSRRPESYAGDFPFPNISDFNPEGDAFPPPRLLCEMWEGVWNVKENRASKGFPLEQGDLGPLSKREVRLLNQLRHGTYLLENRDGVRGKVRVVVDLDNAGKPVLLIVAYPEDWLSKENKHSKPSVEDTCRQILQIEGPLNAWLDRVEPEAAVA